MANVICRVYVWRREVLCDQGYMMGLERFWNVIEHLISCAVTSYFVGTYLSSLHLMSTL
jgi:hypothetical protein